MSFVPFYVGRIPTISKHRANNAQHIKALIERLTDQKDFEAVCALAELPKLAHHEPHDYPRYEEVVSRLDKQGDAETADTICWLLWWNDINAERDKVQRRLNQG